MNALNSIILEGNVVRDPELHTTPKGTAICQFSVAVNRWFKTQGDQVEKEVSFFDVTAWGKLGEQVQEKGNKGRGVRVVGRLKQERWIDTNGKQCSKVLVIAEHVEFRPETKQNDSAPQNMEDSEEDLAIGDSGAETPAVNW
jgi:single-strand DNA-binding protein